MPHQTSPDQAPPHWFVHAVEQPRSTHTTASLDGTALRLVGWNDEERKKPPLLLVHGFLGNTHWWDFTAPFLTANHRVYALDLAGMGGSGWRAHYTTDTFAEDVVAAARFLSASATGQPIDAIAHSFAGTRLLEACVKESALFARAIVVDSKMTLASDRPHALRSSTTSRYYADSEQAIARFRLVPDQPHIDFLKIYLAKQSIIEKPEGWTWKFDPKLQTGFHGQPLEQFAHLIRTPMDLVVGELSNVVTTERAQRLAQLLPRCRSPIVIPQSHHHLMLDQPLALISCLRALLASPHG